MSPKEKRIWIPFQCEGIKKDINESVHDSAERVARPSFSMGLTIMLTLVHLGFWNSINKYNRAIKIKQKESNIF